MVENNKDLIPSGVISIRDTVGIFVKTDEGAKSKFHIIWSNKNIHSKDTHKEVVINLHDKKKENPKLCSNFQFTQTIDGWVMTYIRKEKTKHVLVIASGYDLYDWTVKSTLDVEDYGVTFLQSPGKHGNYLLYLSGLFFTLGRSKDLKHWVKDPRLLLTSRSHEFDNGTLSIFGSVVSKRGNIIFYDASHTSDHTHTLQVGAVIFSKEDPEKIIWRSESPLWTGIVHEHDHGNIYPLGISVDKNTITFYWGTHAGGILSATINTPFVVQQPRAVPKDHLHLVRARKNPILAPLQHNDWESEAVFNPAAVYDNGKIHLFYRAIGRNGISVLGYASSTDGIHFSRRLDHPVYEPGEDYKLPEEESTMPKTYNPSLYASGGGWSGYEDPRAVKIGKRIYVTYLAFGGWDSMRIALTSISEKDLENETWNWDKPTFISPPGEVHKNWVLFPEKIHGKFAILHGISPHVLIHYADSLSDFDGDTFIKSHPPKGGRQEYWDNKMRGVGPPPVKTKLGWLVLYHANDMLEPNRYKLGAMILDKNNPQKILYRASHPILSPDMHYENDGKPGIVYASGAIIKDDRLFVYYGGGDKVVCVASIPLDTLLEKIKKDRVFTFDPKHSLII